MDSTQLTPVPYRRKETKQRECQVAAAYLRAGPGKNECIQDGGQREPCFTGERLETTRDHMGRIIGIVAICEPSIENPKNTFDPPLLFPE